MTAPTTPYTPGPFDSGHWVLQWGGKLPGNEGWSNSMRFALTGGAVTVTPTQITAMKTAVQEFHQAAGANISALAKLSFVKFNPVDVNGHYLSQSTNTVLVADVPGATTETVPRHPHQVAWAVSLITGFSRGLAHRGRFYMPLPSVSLDSGGLTSIIDATNVKTAATNLLTALNAAIPGVKVAVFSRKAGAPTHRLVTGIEVGRVLDTQRRRRRKLLELYV